MEKPTNEQLEAAAAAVEPVASEEASKAEPTVQTSEVLKENESVMPENSAKEALRTEAVEEDLVKEADQEEDKEEEEEEEEEYREISDDGWEDVLGSGRLRKRVIKEGVKSKGRPNRGDVVHINFKGYFQEEMFDDEEGLEFVVSEAEVIQAVDLVVCLMNTGELCEVISDPEFAYGDLGYKEGAVPPKAAVRLEIELIDHQAPLPIGEMEDVQEKLRIGKRKKERGNYWYQRQNYTFAVQCYRKAGEYFDDEKLELEVPIDRYQLPEELQTLLEERLKAFNNLAMSQMKIEAWDAALSSLRQVTKIEPNNEKALYRKSKVLSEKGQIDEAIGNLRRVTRLYPNNVSAKTDLTRLVAKQRKSLLNQQNMSRKMLGLDKYDHIKKAEEEEEARRRGWWGRLVSKKVLVTSALVGLTSLALGGGYFAYNGTRV